MMKYAVSQSFYQSERINPAGSSSATEIEGRRAIRKLSPKADLYQQRAIDAREKTIRILAPAGSGKTQTILNRLLNRVAEGTPPDRFLILTFDNSAVRSITSKLRERLDGSRLNLLSFRIQTLNSLGYEILRNDFPQEYKPIIAEPRRLRLLGEVKQALRGKSADRFYSLPPKVRDCFYLEFFSLLKNELFDPRDLQPQRFADFLLASRQAKPFFDVEGDLALVRSVIEAVGWMFKAYERALQRERLIDFDDQKLRAYIALRKNPMVRRRLQEKYSEIIVDEFQDINRLDLVLIKLLAEKSSLVVTGDDDQAIYGFRNCSSDFIIDLEKSLDRKAASYELRINYRNPANLVEHAAKLIGHNTRRIPKAPVSRLATRAGIEVASSPSAGSEARLVVSAIQKIMRSTPGIRCRDIAVLFRVNAQSLPIQIELALNDIPYDVCESDHILRNEGLEKLIGLLRLILRLQSGKQPDPQDAVLTLRAYFNGLGASTVESLRQLFHQKRNFYEAITSDEAFRILPRIKESRLADCVRETVNARSLTKTLLVAANRFQGIRGMIDESMEERSPLNGILDLAVDFEGDAGRFADVIKTALDRAVETRARQGDDRVALLTYFKSKGLEWRSVILAGCNEDVIPHKRAPVEDERRLFYVAMTRASSNLLISYVHKGANTALRPSRFISEAGLLKP